MYLPSSPETLYFNTCGKTAMIAGKILWKIGRWNQRQKEGRGGYFALMNL